MVLVFITGFANTKKRLKKIQEVQDVPQMTFSEGHIKMCWTPNVDKDLQIYDGK